MNKKEFSKETTLGEMVEYLKTNGCKEVTRILPFGDLVIVEWED